MAFPDDPLGITVELQIGGVWTDVTGDVRGLDGENGIEIKRGRASEQGRVSPSECRLQLNDPAGTYNDDNPASAYYRLLGRNVPLRVSVGADVRFLGEVASFVPDWDGTGSDVVVAVEAAGIMRRLGTGAKPLRSAAYRAIKSAANLVGYWPGEDGTDSTRLVADTAGVSDVIVTGEFTYATDSSIAGSAPLGKLTDTTTLRAPLPLYTAPSTQQWAMTWMWSVPDAPTNAVQVMVVDTPGGTIKYWTLDLNPSTSPDSLVLHGWSAAGADLLAASMDFEAGTASEPYATQLHMAIRCVQDGADVDFQVDCTGPGGTSSLTGTATTSTLGQVTQWRLPGSIPSGDDDAADLTYGHFAVFTSSTALASSAQDLATGWAGETAAARMSRLCSEEGVTFSLIGNASETQTVGPQQIDTLMELLWQAAEVDGGILHEPRDALALTYRTRTNLYNQAPSLELTYGSGHLSGAFRPTLDDQRTRNDVTVSRVDGSSAHYAIPDGDFFHLTTEAHPDGVGVYDEQVTLNTETDDQLDQIAQWRAHLGAWREQRFPVVSVNLARAPFVASAALTADVQAVGLGDLLTVGTSGSLGWLPPDRVELHAQGAEERLAQFVWDFTWNCTPARPWEVWQLDTSGSSLVVAVDDNDTSLKLATSSGPAWSTSAEPYHVQIAGEAMTITAITTDTPAFIAAGTASHAVNNSVSPALPAGITPDTGQLLLVWVAIRNSGTGTVDLPSGWTSIVNFANCRLIGRYYTTGVTAPTITFTGGAAGADTSAQMCAFSGLSMELASGPRYSPAAATQLNGSAQNIAYPYCKVSRDGGVVLYLGWKQDDWTSVTTVGDAEIGEPDTTTGDDQGLVWGYDIYTTAANVSAGSFAVTGGASAISRGIVLALRPLQTAGTVTRSVNGVTGSIAAAEAVHGWRMGVAAL